MIVIRKKRLIIIGGLLCLSLTVFSLVNTFPNMQTVETVTLPVSNKVIVIDARPWGSR